VFSANALSGSIDYPLLRSLFCHRLTAIEMITSIALQGLGAADLGEVAADVRWRVCA